MGDSNGVVSNRTIMDAINKMTICLNKNTDAITVLTTNINDIKEQYLTLKKDLLSFRSSANSEIKALNSTQKDIIKSQDFVSCQIDESNNKITILEERAKETEKTCIGLNSENIKLKLCIENLKKDTNDLAQYGRRNMIELSNIPTKPNENIKAIIKSVASLMKHDSYDETNIDVAHRLNSKLPTPPIIIMFKNRTTRNEFYYKRKFLKNHTVADIHGYSGDQKNFINESLTNVNAVLFKKVRQKCKEANFNSAWTNNGKIFCRKTKESPAIILENENDIARKIM